MAEMTKVTFQDLLARAAELDQVWEWLSPALPSVNPPCGLAEAVEVTNQLRRNAANVVRELNVFTDRRAKLAIALRNASTYYGYQDWDAAEAIEDSTSVSPVTMPGPVGGEIAPDFDSSMVGDLPMPPDIQDGLEGLMTLADQLTAPDQGGSLDWGVIQWKSCANFLQDVRDRTFREFLDWEGDTATQVGKCFADIRNWLDGMVENCKTLSRQAQQVNDAFHDLRTQHVSGPSPFGGTRLYENKVDYMDLERWYLVDPKPRLPELVNIYKGLAKSSQGLRKDFTNHATVSQINPLPPPGTVQVDPDKPFVPIPEPDMDPHHWEPLVPAPRPDQHTDFIPDIIHPAKKPSKPKPTPTPTPTPTPGGNDFHGLPTMPSMPMMPAAKTDPKLDDALTAADVKGAPRGSGGIKPASVGGAGVPAMPLQPWEDGATPGSRPAGSGAGPGNPGRGVPGGAGGMGGGMAGGAPGQAPGQGGGKGKRVQGQEEALYTEEREWTEGLIGRRRVKDAPDK